MTHGTTHSRSPRGSARPRASIWPRFGLLLGLVLILACGQEFRLPPTPPPEPVPDAGRYHYEKSWDLPEPGDVAVAGSYLYVIVANRGADPDTAVKSRVEVYLTNRPDPTPPPQGRIQPFTGLIRPILLSVAKRESTWVVVADAGDSTIKRYHFSGGAPRHTFQHRSYRLIDNDTTYAEVLVWKELSGLAVDDQLNIYVADAERDTIACYDEFGRFVRVVSSAGSGDGFCISARGLEWNGQEMLISDTGQNRVVLVDPALTETATRPPVGLRLNDPRLLLPEDVAGDRNQQFVYIADTGQNRILKYRLTGEFMDSVYSARALDPRLETAILSPRHLAVEEPLVFISDPDHNRLVAFALADSF